jgi:uncharacterized protein YndB with AHSA1/START domain
MSYERVTIEATVALPPEVAWEFWIDPEHITQWNFASADWCCPSAENDLKIGGLYRARMEAKDGSVGFDFEAVYDEVVPSSRLTYTMADGRKATTTFEPQDGSTKVVTVFDAEKQNSIDLQRNGWQSILNNFKVYAESQSSR